LKASLVFAALLASGRAFHVCTVIEPGFNMLQGGGTVQDVTSDKQLEGYDVMLRSKLFQRLEVNYTVQVLPNYAQLHVQTRLGTCDVGWAIFYVDVDHDRCTINQRTCRPLSELPPANELANASSQSLKRWRCCIDYSVQYLPWTLAIMAPAVGKDSFFTALFSSMFQPFVYNFMSFLFIVMVVCAHLVYFCERGLNKQFPASYLEGIDDGIWWALVTATTVGYGDKVPVTPPGKLIAAIYMLVGIALFAILSGHLAAEFVSSRDLKKLETVAELSGKRVCGYPTVLHSSLFEAVAIVKVSGLSMDSCGDLLKEGAVDAVIYDQPIMAYWRSQDTWALESGLTISKGVANPPIGFLFPEAAQATSVHVRLREELITMMREYNEYEMGRAKWFPEAIDANTSSREAIEWQLVAPCLVLLGLYIGLQLVLLMVNWRAKGNFKGDKVAPPLPCPPSVAPADFSSLESKLDSLHEDVLRALKPKPTSTGPGQEGKHAPHQQMMDPDYAVVQVLQDVA